MLAAFRSRIAFYLPALNPHPVQPETIFAPIDDKDLKQSELEIEGDDYFIVYKDTKKEPSILDIMDVKFSKLNTEFSHILSAMDKSCLRALPRISAFIALINTILDYSEEKNTEEEKILQKFFQCVIPLANHAKSKIYFNHVDSLFSENYYCAKVIFLWLNAMSEFRTEKFYPLITENLKKQIEYQLTSQYHSEKVQNKMNKLCPSP